MKNNFITKIIGATLAFAMMIGGAVGINAAKEAKEVSAVEGPATYLHAMSAKPSNGDNTLSSVTWTVSGNNIGSMNTSNYAGVQFGTKSASGSITFTSKNAWGAQSTATSYYGKTRITEIRVWLNAGTGTPTATVTIGGKTATSDGTTVAKNSSAESYEDATCVTYTPATGGDSGIVVITASTSSKAGYFCAMEIDCQEPANDTPTVTVSPDSLFLRTGGEGQTVTATPSNFTGNVSYSWTHQSGTDCVDLANASSATVTMTPKNTITQFASGVYRVTASSGNQSDTADVTVRVDNGGSARPYTIAEARAAIDNGIGKENAYVKGIIYQIDSYSQNYQSLTYWISDDGTNSSPLEVYSGLNLNGTGFSGTTDLSLGDIVVVTGELKKQGSTYEFNYNNQLVSRISIESISVKTAPSNIEYCEDECFDPTGLVVTATYDNATTRDFSYAEVGGIFTFDPSPSVALTNQNSVSITIFGKTTTQPITVTARVVTSVTVTGDMTNKTYVKGSAWDYSGLSLTVAYNIGESNVVSLTSLTAGTDFMVSSEKADGAASLTISGSYNGDAITSRTITDITYTSSITFVAGTDIGSSNTSLSKYGVNITVSNGDLTRNDNYRPYANSTMTITCNGAKIIKISFACTSDGYNTLTGTGYVKDGANGTWTGYSNTVALSASSQSRISQIVVTVSEVNQDDVDALSTSTSLAYRYTGNAQDGFEYSDISIRFGANITKALWNELDTNEHLISGFGVIIADGGIVTNDDDMADAIEDVVSSTVTTTFTQEVYAIDYFVPVANMASTIGVDGNNYFWNLRYGINASNMNKTYAAAAYIKIGGTYVLMNMARESVVTLAQDYLDNRGCTASTAEGSLKAIVDNA